MTGEEAREVDCMSWFGLKFEGLDVPHWLPYLSEADIGGGLKLRVELPDSVVRLNKRSAVPEEKEVA